MFKPSTELWQILINNGFKNVSYHYTKSYHNFYSGPRESYNPRYHRLAFSLGKGISKFIIFLEYNDIELVFGGRNRTIRNASINEKQLRSIIAFFKMPYNRKYALADVTDSKIDQCWNILDERKTRFGYYDFPLDKRFETAFLACKL